MSEQTIIRLPLVQKRTGLSRSTIYSFIEAGKFPASVSLGARAVGWRNSEISEWINTRVKTHDSAAKKAAEARVLQGENQ
jgi:prophage regulatory protein